MVGWQIMALKSAKIAKLQIPNKTIGKATYFLNSVQGNKEGANYGYETPGSGRATSAVGLLCRMYLGWKQDNPALQRGAEYLAATGPSTTNMYYNYYATQVMRHNDGGEGKDAAWKKWNTHRRATSWPLSA